LVLYPSFIKGLQVKRHTAKKSIFFNVFLTSIYP
jgi:hypothetical protein